METIQIHGGVNVASEAWLKALEVLCREFGILLIVDDSDGLGAMWRIFRLRRCQAEPRYDPCLKRNRRRDPDFALASQARADPLAPGDQFGLVQGDNLAFVAATEILSQWNDALVRDVAEGSKLLARELLAIPARFPSKHVRVRGKGMSWGLQFGRSAAAPAVSSWALERGLIVEPARHRDDVMLVLPPITISEETLREGLHILRETVALLFSQE